VRVSDEDDSELRWKEWRSLQNNDQVHRVAPHLLPHLLHPDQEQFGFRGKNVKSTLALEECEDLSV